MACLLLAADIRQQLRKRGVTVMTRLGRLLRSADESGDGKLNKYELEKALVDFHINIEDEVKSCTFFLHGEFPLKPEWNDI